MKVNVAAVRLPSPWRIGRSSVIAAVDIITVQINQKIGFVVRSFTCTSIHEYDVKQRAFSASFR